MAELQGICTPICTIFSEDGCRIDEVAQKSIWIDFCLLTFTSLPYVAVPGNFHS